MSLSWLIMSNFTDFHYIALDDVDLHLSLLFVRKANAAEVETT